MKGKLRDLRALVGEYRSSLSTTYSIYRSIWVNEITKEVKRKMRGYIFWLTIGMIAKMLVPVMYGVLIDGIYDQDMTWIMLAIVGVLAFYSLEEISQMIMSLRRLGVSIDNRRSVELNLTKVLFEKSSGQHKRHSCMLDPSNLNEGRWKKIEVKDMLLFHGIPVLESIAITWIALFILSPVMGVIVGFGIACFMVYAIILNKEVLDKGIPLDEEFRVFNIKLEEVWASVVDFKSMGLSKWIQEVLLKRHLEIDKKDYNVWAPHVKHATLRNCTLMITIVLAVCYGAYVAYFDNSNVGWVVTSIGWLAIFRSNMWTFSYVERSLNWNATKLAAQKEVFDLEPDIVDKPNAIVLESRKVPPRIVFDNVSYSYKKDDGSRIPVLQGVSFSVEPGESLALVGKSGCGKSTIVSLMERFDDVDSGAIYIDGYDIRDIALESWTGMVGVIHQQPTVYTDTMSNNILLATPHLNGNTLKTLENLVERYHLNFGEDRLVNGLDTMLGKEGIELSGGQKQRLAIARIAARDNSVLIVDEATSSLDAETEFYIQKAMYGSRDENRPRTTITIAHRLATILNSDKFVVIRDLATLGSGCSQIETVANSAQEARKESQLFRELADLQGIVIK